MADLFTLLAGRTLGVTPVLQPKLASLYAPGEGLIDRGLTDASSVQPIDAVAQPQPAATIPSGIPASAVGKLSPLVTPTLPTLAIARQPRSFIANSQLIPQPPARPEIVGPESVEAESRQQRTGTVPEASPSMIALPALPAKPQMEPAIAPKQPPLPSTSIQQQPESRQPSATSPSIRPIAQSLVEATSVSIEEPLVDRSTEPFSTRASVTPSSVQPTVLDSTNVSTSSPMTPSVQSLATLAESTLLPSLRLRAEPQSEPQSEVRSEVRSEGAATKQRTVITPRVAPLVPQPAPASTATNAGVLGSVVEASKPAMSSGIPAPPATIQVTIGRIEVRAVMASPPPPPQRRSPAAPKLSLEEYLNARKGGNG